MEEYCYDYEPWVMRKQKAAWSEKKVPVVFGRRSALGIGRRSVMIAMMRAVALMVVMGGRWWR